MVVWHFFFNLKNLTRDGHEKAIWCVEQVFWITMQVLMKILCVIDFVILFSMVQAFQGKIWKEKRLEAGKIKLKICSHNQCQNGDQTPNIYCISFVTIFLTTFCPFFVAAKLETNKTNLKNSKSTS